MSFWNKKRVFLTGHTGFKGSWLTKMLLNRGAEVFGYSLSPQIFPSIYSNSPLLNVIPQMIGDICDSSSLSSAMRRFNPDVVLHLAAQSLVRESYRFPSATFNTNIIGTVNLLESVRHCESVRSVVIVTTDKCYENKEWVWGYRESEPMGGKDPYSASKACAELVTTAYRHSFFKDLNIPVASARAGNVFGGGDWSVDRLIPDLITAFVKNKVALIRAPQSIRPWQFVLEPLEGYLTLAEKNYDNNTFSDGWNFGPLTQDSKTVIWMAEELASRWGKSALFEVANSSQNWPEASILKLDCSKAEARLGWKPRLTLEEGLDLTVSFYRSFYDNPTNVDNLMNEQIEKFEKIKVGRNEYL